MFLKLWVWVKVRIISDLSSLITNIFLHVSFFRHITGWKTRQLYQDGGLNLASYPKGVKDISK